jgi:hypothetical protein
MPNPVKLGKLKVEVEYAGGKLVLVADSTITATDVEGKIGVPPTPPIRHPLIYHLVIELGKLVNKRLDDSPGWK